MKPRIAAKLFVAWLAALITFTVVYVLIHTPDVPEHTSAMVRHVVGMIAAGGVAWELIERWRGGGQ